MSGSSYIWKEYFCDCRQFSLRYSNRIGPVDCLQTARDILHELMILGDEAVEFLVLNRLVSDDSFQHLRTVRIVIGGQSIGVVDVQLRNRVSQAMSEDRYGFIRIDEVACRGDFLFNEIDDEILFAFKVDASVLETERLLME